MRSFTLHIPHQILFRSRDQIKKHGMVGHVARMAKRSDACRVLVDKFEVRSRFDDLGMGG
jgi:hypothetical protein